MVLIKTIDETLDALSMGEEGINHEYDEERVLVKQLAKIIDMKKVYDALGRLYSLLNNSNKSLSKLTDEEKAYCSREFWKGIKLELCEVLQLEDLANELEQEFETKSELPNKRIANIQNILITYFIENSKNKLNNGFESEIVKEELKDYQSLLFTPKSALLKDKEGNLNLDDSIKFFDIKTKELQGYIDLIGKKSVK